MAALERNKQIVVDYHTTAFAGNREKAIVDQHNPDAQAGRRPSSAS